MVYTWYIFRYWSKANHHLQKPDVCFFFWLAFWLGTCLQVDVDTIKKKVFHATAPAWALPSWPKYRLNSFSSQPDTNHLLNRLATSILKHHLLELDSSFFKPLTVSVTFFPVTSHVSQTFASFVLQVCARATPSAGKCSQSDFSVILYG